MSKKYSLVDYILHRKEVDGEKERHFFRLDFFAEVAFDRNTNESEKLRILRQEKRRLLKQFFSEVDHDLSFVQGSLNEFVVCARDSQDYKNFKQVLSDIKKIREKLTNIEGE